MKILRLETGLREGERAVVVKIEGNILFVNYLQTNGIRVGSLIVKNYSPQYSGLTQITVSGKLLSLRNSDFQKIDYVRI